MFMVNHYLLNHLCCFDIKLSSSGLNFHNSWPHVLVPFYYVVSLLYLAHVIPKDVVHFLSQITVEIWLAAAVNDTIKTVRIPRWCRTMYGMELLSPYSIECFLFFALAIQPNENEMYKQCK